MESKTEDNNVDIQIEGDARVEAHLLSLLLNVIERKNALVEAALAPAALFDDAQEKQGITAETTNIKTDADKKKKKLKHRLKKIKKKLEGGGKEKEEKKEKSKKKDKKQEAS